MFQAGLVPSDNITVYYQTSPELAKIITDFSDFINTTIKQPLMAYPVATGSKSLVQEATQVGIIKSPRFSNSQKNCCNQPKIKNLQGFA